MSLSKAIASGKEHRVEYGTKGQPYCKSVDKHCCNHGGRRHQWECVWCLHNRTKKEQEKDKLAKKEMQDFNK